jgi:hypothetical protein
MDWSGILGFAIALGVISLVSWSAEKFMGYLEPLKFDRSLNASPREIPKIGVFGNCRETPQHLAV